ncbi:MAG TPA: glycosyltransferase [Fimbriimonadaceae bacterium]|nr:glycosyltransferase [Fimbriimonadaceae bacterium]
MRVLTLVDYYLPGYKGGGPIQSVSRIVEHLGADTEFFVFTRDRDLGDAGPYPGVNSGHWHVRDGGKTFYASPDQLNMLGILRAVRQVRPQVIYLNSYFSKLSRTVLALRKAGLLRGAAVLVAPRGEFSPGALAIKSGKKRTYLRAASLAGLHKRLTWQVSSVHELTDTRAVIAGDPDYFINAPDIVDVVRPIEIERTKTPGAARFAFVSRVSPKKNLEGAIRMLKGIQGSVEFTIYGPAEDQPYWAKCRAAMDALEGNVRCVFAGPIPPSQVVPALANHHFFLFPTLGENFGHVISEALAAGCPVLLSDQTPWLDLDERGVGWVMSLDDERLWQRRIQDCVDMNGERYGAMSAKARSYIAEVANSSSQIDKSREMFHLALEHQSRVA